MPPRTRTHDLTILEIAVLPITPETYQVLFVLAETVKKRSLLFMLKCKRIKAITKNVSLSRVFTKSAGNDQLIDFWTQQQVTNLFLFSSILLQSELQRFSLPWDLGALL